MRAEQFTAEVEKLNQRIALVNQRIAEAPRPEPGLEGLNHTKMRRTAARLKAGKFLPPGNDMTPEQLADAIERTIAYEKVMKWAQLESLDIAEKFTAMYAAVESEVLDDSLAVFHYGKKLSKEEGAPERVTESVKVMKRSWRESFPRSRGKKKRKHPVT